MTYSISSTQEKVLVAIDIAKVRNDALVQQPNGTRKAFKVANKMSDYESFSSYLKAFELPCLIGFEATGNYHRPLAYYMQRQGFDLCLVSSLAAARTREALPKKHKKTVQKHLKLVS